MIVYFDTSAIVPLVVEEPWSSTCVRLWNDATHVVSVRLLYPEARAALAQADRMGRLTSARHTAAVAELDALITEIDHVELTSSIATTAGALARAHDLRGYDAVHLAAAISTADADFVLATGDHDLAVAALANGLSVARTS